MNKYSVETYSKRIKDLNKILKVSVPNGLRQYRNSHTFYDAKNDWYYFTNDYILVKTKMGELLENYVSTDVIKKSEDFVNLFEKAISRTVAICSENQDKHRQEVFKTLVNTPSKIKELKYYEFNKRQDNRKDLVDPVIYECRKGTVLEVFQKEDYKKQENMFEGMIKNTLEFSNFRFMIKNQLETILKMVRYHDDFQIYINQNCISLVGWHTVIVISMFRLKDANTQDYL